MYVATISRRDTLTSRRSTSCMLRSNDHRIVATYDSRDVRVSRREIVATYMYVALAATASLVIFKPIGPSLKASALQLTLRTLLLFRCAKTTNPLVDIWKLFAFT